MRSITVLLTDVSLDRRIHTLPDAGAGDHPELYEAVAVNRAPIVKRVEHDADASSLDQSAWHIMAYVPLRTAPWGVAMGASEAEVLEPVSRLRTRFVAIGAASLVPCWWEEFLRLVFAGESNDLTTTHSDNSPHTCCCPARSQ